MRQRTGPIRLFKVSVAVAFQPKVLAGNETFSDPSWLRRLWQIEQNTKGSTELSIDPIAMPHWLLHVRRLDTQLTPNFSAVMAKYFGFFNLPLLVCLQK